MNRNATFRHEVQFYSSDSALLEGFARFIRNTSSQSKCSSFKGWIIRKTEFKEKTALFRLNRAAQKISSFRKASWNQPITDVLRRPSEPARVIGNLAPVFVGSN